MTKTKRISEFRHTCTVPTRYPVRGANYHGQLRDVHWEPGWGRRRACYRLCGHSWADLSTLDELVLVEDSGSAYLSRIRFEKEDVVDSMVCD